MKKILVAGLLVALTVGCTSKSSVRTNDTTVTSASLDGRTFLVEAADASKVELAFTNGMLDSSACRAKGLAPVRYTVRSDGTFYAERRDGDTVDTWTGRATSDAIEGTFVTVKRGATTTNIPFRGRVR